MSSSTGTKSYKLVVVDDHPLVREGLKQVLNRSESNDIEIVGEVSNSDELFEFLKNEHPDIILLDINLPGKNGDRKSVVQGKRGEQGGEGRRDKTREMRGKHRRRERKDSK